MKKELTFLTVEDVIGIHQDQLRVHGGRPGILNMTLLESAVAMAGSRHFGEFAHRDVFEMAAAYLFHLAKNHAFADGNKRVAADAAETFLDANGFELAVGEPEYADFVLKVAAGEAGKAEAAEFYRRHAQPVDDR
jgi:death-on-curing protein